MYMDYTSALWIQCSTYYIYLCIMYIVLDYSICNMHSPFLHYVPVFDKKALSQKKHATKFSL